jgi:hypothetical protein
MYTFRTFLVSEPSVTRSLELPDGGGELRSAVELPSHLDHLIQSWDMALKDLPGTLLAVRRLSGQWPNAH